MRSGFLAAMAIVLVTAVQGVCSDRMIGEPVALGPLALDARMRTNPEMAGYVMRWGYPDWAEEVEVDSVPPLSTRQVRLYYLRLDREIAFTRAFALGRPEIGIRRYDRPMAPAMREWIARMYLAHDPARRAEAAAERAIGAAERAEHAADVVEDVVAKSEHYVDEMERSFHKRKRSRK